MRVTINAGGREVTIEAADANLTPKDLANHALAVWRLTENARESMGGAFGLTSQISVVPSRRRHSTGGEISDG